MLEIRIFVTIFKKKKEVKPGPTNNRRRPAGCGPQARPARGQAAAGFIYFSIIIIIFFKLLFFICFNLNFFFLITNLIVFVLSANLVFAPFLLDLVLPL